MGVIAENMSTYVDGFMVTLRLTALSGLFALLIGATIAAFRVSPLRPLRVFGTVWTETLRNTPLTLIFFGMVFVAPQFGIIPPLGFWTAVICLATYTSAFVAEALRSGINSVGIGQAEAARSIGLTFSQTLSSVILPQAFRTVIPPLINVLIALTKNTSVAAGFAVVELVAAGRRVGVTNAANSAWVLIGVALMYLVITIPLGVLASRVERKVAFAR